MPFHRIAVAAASLVILCAPLAVSAQTNPYSQVVISAQMVPGTAAPVVAPIISITATSPSMAGIPNANSSTISYASSFSNDVRTATFVPGSYSVTATGPSGYYFTYSTECSGFTSLSGSTRGCAITMTTVPPHTGPTCPTSWYTSNGSTCVAPVTPYQGPWNSGQLSCNPTFQTIGMGQAATFTATGGSGTYSWTTPSRTSLNVGPSFTTVFQTSGTQTVIVSSGVQNATCTINVGASVGAVTYTGTIGGTPSIISNYIPALLPNTGFGPQNGAAFAFAFVLLAAAGILFAPYVRKALAVTLG